MSQLNKSVVVIDEPDREVKEKEKELARKKKELERRERELKRREGERNKENCSSPNEVVFQNLERIVAGPSSHRDDDSDEDDKEMADFSK